VTGEAGLNYLLFSCICVFVPGSWCLDLRGCAMVERNGLRDTRELCVVVVSQSFISRQTLGMSAFFDRR
jgi:hypothetical protein